jgi:hypothetical protein
MSVFWLAGSFVSVATAFRSGDKEILPWIPEPTAIPIS